MNNLSDQEIIEGLKSTRQSENDKTFRFLYKQYYPMIESFITYNSGTSDDSKDIFQESIIVLYNKVKHENLALSCSLKTYIYSICKKMWYDRLRTDKNHQRILKEQHASIDIEEDFSDLLQMNERRDIMLKLLRDLGEECRKVLLLFYYEKFSMQQIAEGMKYSSEQVAKNKKSRCMKTLRESVFNNPEIRDELR